MNILGDLAPALLSALTGNIPGVAISAAKGVADIFGWNYASVDSVVKQLSGVTEITSTQQIDLVKLEYQFQSQMTQTQVQDKENARQYSSKHAMADILSVFMLLVWVINLKSPTFLPIPDDQKANIIIPAIIAIFSYYFGGGQWPGQNLLGWFKNGKKTD